MKRLLSALLLLIVAQLAYALPDVPEKMRFCDIELNLTAEARTKIGETVAKIERSPAHFQSLVDRANIYFPFIDEAFNLREVPKDLKYIVIQESSLISDIVSSSNAVGFWQFKEASGRESGLTIDALVDERKHIFLSSLAAAKYFYTIARYYDNYLYAVIGYNRGPVGAIPFTEEANYGERKMTVTGETHWYALHAIATKLAYENAVGKTDPPMWLQPLSSHGETEVSKLAAAQSMTLEDFKKYNTWILGNSLPVGKDYVYYVPRKGKPELTLMRHINSTGKQVGAPKPIVPIEKPKPAIAIPDRDTRKFTYLEPQQDVDHGLQYVRFKENGSLVEVAVHNGVKIKKLLAINGFTNYHRPHAGDIIYLKPTAARGFHIVQAGESLSAIATKYETTVEKLRSKNRISGNAIFAGQKLSLKKQVPKGQKPILLATMPASEEVEVAEASPNHVDAETVEMVAGEGVLSSAPSSYRLPPFESKMVTHTVAPNESVWKVARKYGAYADVVKKLNNLSSNELKVGQTIKVLQVTDRQ